MVSQNQEGVETQMDVLIVCVAQYQTATYIHTQIALFIETVAERKHFINLNKNYMEKQQSEYGVQTVRVQRPLGPVEKEAIQIPLYDEVNCYNHVTWMWETGKSAMVSAITRMMITNNQV